MPIYQRYRHLAIEWSKGPPALAEVAAIERKLGRALPADFLEFLSVANGGSCDYLVSVPVKPGGLDMCFPAIFLAGKDRLGNYGEDTFLYQLASERDEKKIPREVLPFAHSGDDALLYLDLTDQGNGRVVAFVPGWAGGVEGIAKSSFVVVAPSFADLVDLWRVDVVEAERAAREAFTSGKPELMEPIREYLEIGLPDWRERFGLKDVD